MVAQRTLRSQLSGLKLHFWIFGRPEIKELRKILRPSEIIRHCVHGYYHGGSGLLVATNERLMLIDKRPFFLNVEELQYQQIQGVSFRQDFLTGVLSLQSPLKKLEFRSVSDARLREIVVFVKDEIEFARKRFAQVLKNSNFLKHVKPAYQNPGWRPHHPTLLPRRNPRKFYGSNHLARQG